MKVLNGVMDGLGMGSMSTMCVVPSSEVTSSMCKTRSQSFHANLHWRLLHVQQNSLTMEICVGTWTNVGSNHHRLRNRWRETASKCSYNPTPPI